MAQKRRPRPREIEASKLVLRDTRGKPRIILDAGGDNGHASICIFSSDGHGNAQIASQPSGAVVMSFGNENFDGMLTLSAAGFVLRARDGRFGVVIGPDADGRDRISVYQDGEPAWTSAASDEVRRPHRPSGKRRRASNGG